MTRLMNLANGRSIKIGHVFDHPNGDAQFDGVVWHDPSRCSNGMHSRIRITWLASGCQQEMNASQVGCEVVGAPWLREVAAA